MAHSERSRENDNRRHPLLYKRGTAVGMMTERGMAKGTIRYHDAGGWIYVYDWRYEDGKNACDECPSYMRSTNVIVLNDDFSQEEDYARD